MRYRSISFLVKYEKKYDNIAKQLKGIDYSLFTSLLQCPTLYSDDCDHQSYMLVRDEIDGVGAVYIGTSCDEKDLEVTLQLIEGKYDSELDMYKVINQLVDSLGRYFYDKENIYINLINKIDLSIFDKFKYKREYCYMGMDTFCCSNKKYNALLPLLLSCVKLYD